MRKIQYSLVVVIFLLIVGQFLLGLLTNYATATIPQFLTQRPYLVWTMIGTVLTVLFGLTLAQRWMESRGRVSVPQIVTHQVPGGTMQNNFDYDVFVSYSHKNSDWVHQVLVPELENHGFSVFTDTKFKSGAFSPVQMEEGVKNSKRVIAVFTPEYFKSDWSTLENVMAQILDPATRNRKLIPILRETSDIPLRLAGIHYRDLRVDDKQEWQRLMQDLI